MGQDFYGSGDDRVDAIIDDGTGAVERWYHREHAAHRHHQTVMGDVIEYDGRVWIQSLAQAPWNGRPATSRSGKAAIADVAQDPFAYEGEVIQLTGFIGESIAPDARSLRLTWVTTPATET